MIIVNEIWHCSSLSNVLYLCVVRSRMSCCPRQYESIAADGQMSTLLPFIAGGIVITWTGLSECRCNMHEILNAPDTVVLNCHCRYCHTNSQPASRYVQAKTVCHAVEMTRTEVHDWQSM